MKYNFTKQILNINCLCIFLCSKFIKRARWIRQSFNGIKLHFVMLPRCFIFFLFNIVLLPVMMMMMIK